MKINYQVILEKTLKDIQRENKRPKLLLHSCCAPCSSHVLEFLNQYFDITVLFYNPNLIDQEEFDKRYNEQIRINEGLSQEHAILLVKIPYDQGSYLSAVKGYEAVKEGGIRCKICFEMRLIEAAKYGKMHGFDYFTTSLSISPLKNAQLLNQLGLEIEKSEGIKYLQSDFKKKNGYKRSVELSKLHDLYRQDYCGCIFSKVQREENN